MFKDSVLPVGLSPEPVKRTSPTGLEGSSLPGTPRYTPAWEKTGNVVSRAFATMYSLYLYVEEWEEYEEFEEWEEDEFEDECEEYNDFNEFIEYLDNQWW